MMHSDIPTKVFDPSGEMVQENGRFHVLMPFEMPYSSSNKSRLCSYFLVPSVTEFRSFFLFHSYLRQLQISIRNIWALLPFKECGFFKNGFGLKSCEMSPNRNE